MGSVTDTLTWPYLLALLHPQEAHSPSGHGPVTSDLAEGCWEAGVCLSVLPKARELEGMGFFLRQPRVSALR